MGIEIRRPVRQPRRLNAGAAEKFAKRLAELAVTIHEQVPTAQENAILITGSVPGDLIQLHPDPLGVRVKPAYSTRRDDRSMMISR